MSVVTPALPLSRLEIIQRGNPTMVLSGNTPSAFSSTASVLPLHNATEAADPAQAAGVSFASPGFAPALTQWNFVRVLLVGAGGIGCEVLHLLVMSGLYSHVTVMDMDRIAGSNLNRQFLFTEVDVGRWKSEVAAEKVNAQFAGVRPSRGGVHGSTRHQSGSPSVRPRNYTSQRASSPSSSWSTSRNLSKQSEKRNVSAKDDVLPSTPRAAFSLPSFNGPAEEGEGVKAVVGRLEDQPLEFYRQFDLFILAVDSVEARRWLNQTVARISQWGAVQLPSDSPSCLSFERFRVWWRILDAPPIVDCGTEGFQGHCRVISMSYDPRTLGNETPCVECLLDLFPQAEHPPSGAPFSSMDTVPLCTLENIPRRPEHCVLYAKEHLWVEEQRHQWILLQKHRDAMDSTPFTSTEEKRQSGDKRRRVDGSTEAFLCPAFDVSNAEHVDFVTEAARARQVAFRLPPPRITASFVRHVLQHVVPAVSFTNAFIAAQAVTEVMKRLTGVAPVLDNYSYYNGNAAPGVGVHALVEHFHVPSLQAYVPQAEEAPMVSGDPDPPEKGQHTGKTRTTPLSTPTVRGGAAMCSSDVPPCPSPCPVCGPFPVVHLSLQWSLQRVLQQWKEVAEEVVWSRLPRSRGSGDIRRLAWHRLSWSFSAPSPVQTSFSASPLHPCTDSRVTASVTPKKAGAGTLPSGEERTEELILASTSLVSSSAVFTTRDGVEHPTWNGLYLTPTLPECRRLDRTTTATITLVEVLQAYLTQQALEVIREEAEEGGSGSKEALWTSTTPSSSCLSISSPPMSEKNRTEPQRAPCIPSPLQQAPSSLSERMRAREKAEERLRHIIAIWRGTKVKATSVNSSPTFPQPSSPSSLQCLNPTTTPDDKKEKEGVNEIPKFHPPCEESEPESNGSSSRLEEEEFSMEPWFIDCEVEVLKEGGERGSSFFSSVRLAVVCAEQTQALPP